VSDLRKSTLINDSVMLTVVRGTCLRMVKPEHTYVEVNCSELMAPNQHIALS
jgi:hypothetical protein